MLNNGYKCFFICFPVETKYLQQVKYSWPVNLTSDRYNSASNHNKRIQDLTAESKIFTWIKCPVLRKKWFDISNITNTK